MPDLPPIFVISLARAAARREKVRAQLNSLGLRYTMIDAVDGAALDLAQYSDRLRFDKWKFLRGRELSRGEIGCFLSHYQLWEKLAAQQTQCALVLEDDISPDENFAEVAAAAAKVKWWWDVILLSARKRYKIDRVLCDLPHGRRLVRFNKRVGTTRAYLINQSGIKKLLGICRDISAPIDWRYAEWWLNGIEYYAAITKDGKHPSTIGEPNKMRRGVGEYLRIRRPFSQLAGAAKCPHSAQTTNKFAAINQNARNLSAQRHNLYSPLIHSFLRGGCAQRYKCRPCQL